MSDAALPIVDAHQHFWDLGLGRHPWLRDEPPVPFRYGDYRAIRRSYMPADYRRDCGPHRVVGSVYVETEWDPLDPLGESRWAQALAEREGLPSAIVAQAWLDRDDLERVLEAHARLPLVRGIRQKPRAAPSPDRVEKGAPGSMGDPAWRRGFQKLAEVGFSFDLQTPWWHLPEAAELAQAVQEVPIILNQTRLPADRSPSGLAGWRSAMRRLAQVPHVALKISGLGLPGRPWTVADNGPIVREAIEIFGTRRCMMASNFPVDSLVADLPTIWSGFLEITADLAPDDRRRLFHDNAVRIYRLAPTPAAAPPDR
jgi:predicted TIM-barrel fold metal-dependent hydrolase